MPRSRRAYFSQWTWVWSFSLPDAFELATEAAKGNGYDLDLKGKCLKEPAHFSPDTGSWRSRRRLEWQVTDFTPEAWQEVAETLRRLV